MRDKLGDEFDYLEQCSMTISQSGSQLYTLSRDTTTSIYIKPQEIRKFIKGLSGYYQLVIPKLMVLGGSLNSIIDHNRVIILVVPRGYIDMEDSVVIYYEVEISPVEVLMVTMVDQFR